MVLTKTRLTRFPQFSTNGLQFPKSFTEEIDDADRNLFWKKNKKHKINPRHLITCDKICRRKCKKVAYGKSEYANVVSTAKLNRKYYQSRNI